MRLLLHISSYVGSDDYRLPPLPDKVKILEYNPSKPPAKPFDLKSASWYSSLGQNDLDRSFPKLCIVHFSDAEAFLNTANIQEYNRLNFYWIGYSSISVTKPPKFPTDPHCYWAISFSKIKNGLPQLLEDWERRLALNPAATPIFTILECRSRHWMHRFGEILEPLTLQNQVKLPALDSILSDLTKENPNIADELTRQVLPKTIFDTELSGCQISQLVQDIHDILRMMDKIKREK